MARVLLVYPSLRLLGYRFPYSLIPIANYLKARGHEAVVFDAQVENMADFHPEGFDLVGFSILSGPQIKSALAMAATVRQRCPQTPIVFGGVHATLLPEQTAEHPLVDIVTRQEGEITTCELAETIVDGGDLSTVQGITYTKDGEVVSTPDRPFLNLDETPFLNYDFLKTERYVEFQRKPSIIYLETSRGCPHKCGFCYDPVFHKRKWRSKSPERVVDELEFVVRKYGVEQVWFTDDEFAVSQKRVAAIAELLIKRGVKLKWPIFSRANYVVKYDKEFLDLIRRAGCDWINFGVESGSPRILKLINKQITVDQVIRSVEILRDNDLNAGLSFMIGFPGESVDEMRQTFELIDTCSNMYDKVWIGQISAFTPLPGTALMQNCIDEGYTPPASLEEWGEFYYNDPKNLAHFERSMFRLIRTITLLTKFDFAYRGYRGAGILENRKLLKAIHYSLCKIAQWRWQKKLFAFPVEWVALDYALSWLKFGER